jgi:eukaryotic-like serine/threonine-protein kinase
MPRAEMSLEDRLAAVDQAIDQAEGIDILIDVATALESLHSRVVHRDFNSGNVLLYQGDWCLTDFGISRYAVATTDLATRKCSLTPAYAAPEQWHHGRATGATDVYAFGVVAFQILSGRLPFEGSSATERRCRPRASTFRSAIGRRTACSARGRRA